MSLLVFYNSHFSIGINYKNIEHEASEIPHWRRTRYAFNGSACGKWLSESADYWNQIWIGNQTTNATLRRVWCNYCLLPPRVALVQDFCAWLLCGRLQKWLSVSQGISQIVSSSEMLQLEAEIEILPPTTLQYRVLFILFAFTTHRTTNIVLKKRGIWAHFGIETLRRRQYLMDLNVVGMKLR